MAICLKKKCFSSEFPENRIVSRKHKLTQTNYCDICNIWSSTLCSGLYGSLIREPEFSKTCKFPYKMQNILLKKISYKYFIWMKNLFTKFSLRTKFLGKNIQTWIYRTNLQSGSKTQCEIRICKQFVIF